MIALFIIKLRGIFLTENESDKAYILVHGKLIKPIMEIGG
jgi:hypothetical protein